MELDETEEVELELLSLGVRVASSFGVTLAQEWAGDTDGIWQKMVLDVVDAPMSQPSLTMSLTALAPDGEAR